VFGGRSFATMITLYLPNNSCFNFFLFTEIKGEGKGRKGSEERGKERKERKGKERKGKKEKEGKEGLGKEKRERGERKGLPFCCIKEIAVLSPIMPHPITITSMLIRLW
jgi:hypothetical protein